MCYIYNYVHIHIQYIYIGYIYKDNFIFINGIIQFFTLFNAIYYFLKKSFMKLILISYSN